MHCSGESTVLLFLDYFEKLILDSVNLKLTHKLINNFNPCGFHRMLLQNIPRLSKWQDSLSKLFHWIIFFLKESISYLQKRDFTCQLDAIRTTYYKIIKITETLIFVTLIPAGIYLFKLITIKPKKRSLKRCSEVIILSLNR